MKKLHGTVSFVTALLMLFSVLASCAAQDNASETADTASSETVTSEAVTDVPYDIPEVNDYNGYTYRISMDESRHTGPRIMFTDEANGEVMNDAVFARNEKIEELYNIEIKGVPDAANDLANTVKKAVMAGDDYCDIAAIRMRNHFAIAQEGVLHELNELNIDFEQPWWDTGVLEAFEVSGKNYTIVGDITTTEDIFVLIMYFNQKLYSDLGFEDPYTMVSEGRWIYENFWKMAQEGSYDLNGDGAMDLSDQWGFITEQDAWYYFSTGSGLMPIAHESDGTLRYTLDDEKTFNLLERTKEAFLSEEITLIANTVKIIPPHTTVWEVVEAMFRGNQGLFKSGTFNDVTRYRDMEIDFGVLPMPKFDEAQESYYNLVTHHTDAVTFPITVSDIDRTLNITDALGYESMISINPCFYEIFLDEKLVRDESSKGMIDIILDTKVYDLEWTATISSLVSKMASMVGTRNDNFASEWASIKEAANAKLDAFVEIFNN